LDGAASNTDAARIDAQDASSGVVLVPQGAQSGAPPLAVDRIFTLIGARPGAKWRLLSAAVSRSHAALILNGTSVYVRDLASRTRLFVNGSVAREPELCDGDELQIGPFVFNFRQPPAGLLAAPVEAAPAAALYPANGRPPVPIVGRTLLIGRRPTCDLHIPSATVSIAHALLFELDGAHYIRDMLSRTGTHVNGAPIKQQKLNPDDHVRIGEMEFRYGSVDAAARAAAQAAIPPAVDVSKEETQPASAVERLSSSGTFADVQFDANEALHAGEEGKGGPDAPPRPQAQPTTLTIEPIVATYGYGNIALTARVESAAGPVGKGAVTFNLRHEAIDMGSSPPVPVSAGRVAVNLPLRDLAPGSYVIQAAYDPMEAADQFGPSGGGNTLTVRKAPAALRLRGLSAIYDGSPKTVSVVAEPASLQGISITYGGSPQAPTDAGRYPVVAQLDHPLYRATPVSAVLVIAKAPLALTAADQQRPASTDNPPLTGSLNGLRGGDKITAIFSTRAKLSSPPGSYEITARLSDPDGRLKNYALSYTHGTMTVTPPSEPAIADPAPDDEPTMLEAFDGRRVPDAADVLAADAQPLPASESSPWSIGCDQASFIGGVGYSADPPCAKPRRAARPTLPGERNTSVSRGGHPLPGSRPSNGDGRSTASSPPASKNGNDIPRPAEPSAGFFRRFTRLLGFSGRHGS